MTDAAAKDKRVRIERDELGVYTVTNADGATLRFGRGEGLLSPVDLLLAAVGGCSAIDLDHMTSKRAEPSRFTVSVDANRITDANGGHRLTDLGVDFDVEFADDEAGRAAEAFVERTIGQSRDRLCTVSRTVEAATPVEFSRGGTLVP